MRAGRHRLTGREVGIVSGSWLVGALGCLPSVTGSPDPVALSAWLALIAVATGFVCGSSGLAPWPWTMTVPAVWAMLLVWTDASSSRDLATPLWGMAVVGGLVAGGWGLGAWRSWRPGPVWAGAGVLVLVALACSGAGVQGSLPRGDTSWARHHPRLAAALYEISPLTLVLEAAGWDWSHANPDVYRLSGVEWFQRAPHRGKVAGPVSLVVGCVLAAGAAGARRARAHRPRTS